MTTPTPSELLELAERYRTTLLAIRRYCENATFGGWRHEIAYLIDCALARPKPRASQENSRG